MKKKSADTKKRRPSSHSLLSFFLLFAYFLALSVFFTRPLFSRLRTHTVGWRGDNMYFLFQIEWIRQALFDLKVMPLTTHLLNYPYGYSLLSTEISPLQILFALPFAAFDEAVLGFNLSMLLTFIISGMAMYFWLYAVSGSRHAGLAAGTAYAFLPYHIVHFMAGHLNISGIQWFPLYFWGFTSLLTDRQASWKHVLLTAAGISAIALTSLYYAYMTLLISALMFFLYWLFTKNPFDRDCWRRLFISAGLSIPGLIAGVGPYLYFHGNRGSTRPLVDAMRYSASVSDFFLPFTRQLLLGRWVWDKFPRDLWNEATLYLGIAVTALAVFAVLAKNSKLDKRLWELLLIGGMCAFILALGVNLNWMEAPVMIRLPEWIASRVGAKQSLVYLPAYLAYKYLPFYSLMRVSMRYGVIVMTVVCFLAGMGVHEILKMLKKPTRNIAFVVILGFIILDFSNTPMPTVRIGPRNVDEWLNGQPTGGLVQLPYEQSTTSEHAYYTVHHQKPLMGVISAFPSDRLLGFKELLRNFPDAVSVSTLQDEEIRYVVVDEEEMPIGSEMIRNAEEFGMRYAGSFNGQSVFIFE